MMEMGASRYTDQTNPERVGVAAEVARRIEHNATRERWFGNILSVDSNGKSSVYQSIKRAKLLIFES